MYIDNHYIVLNRSAVLFCDVPCLRFLWRRVGMVLLQTHS